MLNRFCGLNIIPVMIKNIIFDMGGVLLNFSPRSYVDRYNLPEEDKQILLDKIFYDYRWPLLDFGYYDTEKDLYYDVKDEIPQRLWKYAEDVITTWRKGELTFIEGTADIVAELKNKGYGIYLLSNAGPNHKDYWPKIKGSQYFDGVMVSAVEKMYKPCIEIFEHCLKKFNLRAEECVFVDDLAVNCAGAYMAGIKPVVFKNAKQLREDLKKLEVL